MSEDDDGTVSWAALLDETTSLLQQHDAVENPGQEARWIVEAATGARGTEFVDALRSLATVRGVAHLDDMVRRRLAGEPIQYVLGSWSFRSLDLMVDKRALIPRPETEVMVGLALTELDRMRPDGGGTVVDLGTGSGAIGLSIAAERPVSRVLLTDRSPEAIAVARANLAGLGLAGRSVEIAEGDWFDAIPDRYLGECDVIASNPPYVPDGDRLDPSVAEWEPAEALRAGPEGLDDLRVLVDGAGRWLRPGGALVLEMDPRQVELVRSQAASHGFDTTVHDDLAGVPRVVIARML